MMMMRGIVDTLFNYFGDVVFHRRSCKLYPRLVLRGTSTRSGREGIIFNISLRELSLFAVKASKVVQFGCNFKALIFLYISIVKNTID